jgi:hypothetical protein
VLLAFDDARNRIRNSLNAHLWLQIIRRDLRRWHHVPLLVRELRLDATVEEERDVCIFFGLYLPCQNRLPKLSE